MNCLSISRASDQNGISSDQNGISSDQNGISSDQNGISYTVICSGDIPFWLETLDLLSWFVVAAVGNEVCRVKC